MLTIIFSSLLFFFVMLLLYLTRINEKYQLLGMLGIDYNDKNQEDEGTEDDIIGRYHRKPLSLKYPSGADYSRIKQRKSIAQIMSERNN